jgi:hypothetical protein
MDGHSVEILEDGKPTIAKDVSMHSGPVLIRA